MKKIGIYLLIAVSGAISSCLDEDLNSYEAELISWTDFEDGSMDTWVAGFAQYPVGLEDSFALSHGIGDLFTSSHETKSVVLRGKSWNKDLFMFVKGEIGGLDADTFYDVYIDVELYSELLEVYDEFPESDMLGSYLKVGAMTDEPLVSEITDTENLDIQIAELDIDIGIEYEGAANVINLGKLVYSEPGFEAVLLRGYNMENPIRVKSNSEGKLWLLVGIDNNVSIYQEVHINFIGGRYGKVIF